jgi:hypothetical protein
MEELSLNSTVILGSVYGIQRLEELRHVRRWLVD